jgi:hypothetical protein
MLLPPCRLVTCTPADPIIVHIQDYRATLGGWLRLAFKNVAGDAALTAVELATSGSDFRAPVSACRTRYPAALRVMLLQHAIRHDEYVTIHHVYVDRPFVYVTEKQAM